MEEYQKDRFQEIKQHGSLLFPFNIYPCTIPKDFPTVALHWQKSMELIYIKKGHGQVQVDMNIMSAEKDDIFVIPPGTLHAMRQMPGYEMEYENIIFDVDFLGGGAADICAQEYLVPIQAGQLLIPVRLRREDSDYAAFEACLVRAEELCKWKEKGYELGVKSVMLYVLYLLVQRNPKPLQKETPDTERLKAVLQRVEQEYGTELSVPAAAKGCGLSASHFMRWFKQMTGTSFNAYLNERRLAAAAEALCHSDAKILNIAEQVGFSNLSNFNRQFLARYGVTPSEYRDS